MKSVITTLDVEATACKKNNHETMNIHEIKNIMYLRNALIQKSLNEWL